MATYYTSIERARMTAAISAYDRTVAIRAAIERVARLAIIALGLFITIFMFYVSTA